MSRLKIKDMPPVEVVDGTEIIPTGGKGDVSVTVERIKNFVYAGTNFTSLASQLQTVDLRSQNNKVAIDSHIADLLNPHQVTKAQVGLSNVDNTSDLNKPISTATQAALTTLDNTKANTTYVDSGLNVKANITYVDDNLSLKENLLALEAVDLIPSSSFDNVKNTNNLVIDSTNQSLLNRTEYLKTHNNLVGRDVANAHPASAIVDASGKTQQQVNDYLKSSQTSGIGDFNLDNVIHIWCGDSTTEQMQSSGGGADTFAAYRATGGHLASAAGMINFGGSGYTLNGFVNDAATAGFVGPSLGASAGMLNWDSWFHKPTGAISQKTALEWRSRYPSYKVVWTLCYGINDLILYAANGNLSQDAIVDYLVPLLRKAISNIKTQYPQDLIVLRVPNPMTYAPYNAQFPSAVAYPAFDTDPAATSQALVEKWNQALRQTYLKVQGEFSRTILLDTWKDAFGDSNTTLTATTQLPFLGDRVHPSVAGYSAIATSYVRLLTKSALVSPRVLESQLRSSALVNNPWDNYAGYFDNNPSYKKALETTLVGVGSNYMDIGVPLSTFQSFVATGSKIYVVIDQYVAQAFSAYNAVASGNNTRFTGIAVNAKMQTATHKLKLTIYVDNNVPLLANDTYVNANAYSAKEVYTGKITDAGNGYIRFTLDALNGRMSTNFRDGVLFGKFVIGGTVGQIVDFSLGGWSVLQSGGSASARIFQFNKAGTDYTSWNNQPAALTFSDTHPSPKSYERIKLSGTTDATVGTQTAIAHGLGYTPVEVHITPKGNGVVYVSANADATNIYVKGGAASIPFDAYVR